MSVSSVCYIAITFDMDSDFFDSSLVAPGVDERSLLQWRGIDVGVPLLVDVLTDYSDSDGSPIRATWFVRADGQLRREYGDPAYLFERYRGTWMDLQSSGHEIAWHPHFYRHDGGRWQLETRPAELRQQTDISVNAITALGFSPRSSRVGECFGSNELMAILDEHGFTCDSSAMPGRKRDDSGRMFDWRRTPLLPYHPSRGDYQETGEDVLDIVEVPFTMVETLASYDRHPVMRYVDLAFRHDVLRGGLRKIAREKSLIVTVTHPSTVLSDVTSREHGLISFDIAQFRSNLEFLLNELRSLNRTFRFICIRECGRLFG